MKFVGQEPLPYRLTKVEPLRGFVDETPLGDIVVRVSHRLEPLESVTCASPTRQRSTDPRIRPSSSGR